MFNRDHSTKVSFFEKEKLKNAQFQVNNLSRELKL